MKTPVVDYRQFRLTKLNDPRFSHLKLLGGWIGYFIMYFLTENLIPMERMHVIHCALDDVIPFNEYFLIFYCSWYAWIVISLLYFMLYDIDSFRRLQVFIIITQVVAMVVYIVYPSIQLLRPEVFPRENALTALMAFIYNFDTPTGVCPSLHVAYSMGIASVWCKRKETPAVLKVFMVCLLIMISISTAFVKQHSVVDIVAAIPLGMLAEYLVFGRTQINRQLKIRSGSLKKKEAV
jgi:membrane-associated phospholipid phosphatase